MIPLGFFWVFLFFKKKWFRHYSCHVDASVCLLLFSGTMLQLLVNTLCTAEWGPRSSWLCTSRLWNEALVPQILLLLSWKTQPNWNRFQNKLPSGEGRELYHFLLHCFWCSSRQNMMASQRNISFWSTGIHFPWILIVSIKMMTRTMDGCLILNKLGRRRVKLSQRMMATLQC